MSLSSKMRRLATVSATALSTAAAPMIFATALSQPGCFFFGSGPSSVSQGQQYRSGDPQFDQFFTELYELQVEMGEAPNKEAAIRADLAKRFELDADASASLLAKAVEKRSKQMADAGTGVTMKVDDLDDSDAELQVETVGENPSSENAELIAELRTSIEKELKLYHRMRANKRQLDKLLATVTALDANVDATFRKGGPSKKNEVRKNLEDAQTLIPLMQARAEEVGDAAKKVVKELTEAATNDYEPPPPPPPEPEPEEGAEEGEEGKKPGEKTPGATKPGGGWKPPASGGGSPPPPKPPPPKPPPSDFEP